MTVTFQAFALEIVPPTPITWHMHEPTSFSIIVVPGSSGYPTILGGFMVVDLPPSQFWTRDNFISETNEGGCYVSPNVRILGNHQSFSLCWKRVHSQF